MPCLDGERMAARSRANSAAQFLPRMMSCPISEEIAIGTFVSASKSLQLRLTTGRRVVSPCTPVRAIEVDGWGTGAPSVSSCLSRLSSGLLHCPAEGELVS